MTTEQDSPENHKTTQEAQGETDPFLPQTEDGSLPGPEDLQGAEDPAGDWPAGTKKDAEGKEVLTEH